MNFSISRYKNFINTVCIEEAVYCLKNKDGVYKFCSNHYEKENGEEVLVFCFWSSEEMIKAYEKEQEQLYNIVRIPLDLFLKDWCIEMHEGSVLAGVDYNSDLYCCEIEALKLGVDILEELVEHNKLDNFIEIYNLYNNHLS
ncbi:DUF2750 domain-containing protein [Myroides injenensis]|uniref:DUF2750 domain-containing protein n=1 Tax=Myroides injenensis TaxID=1183151 RepID=UPI00028933C1|nr:DUF2750 domain-containing protein [Myroides injenensis]